ncbi:MAG: helix-turn-helix transcriptional regulator [Oscillospiraceae bacterium]|nr:helix-turn-helix transcriptional regulator [Oscillospiraceae bacterium]
MNAYKQTYLNNAANTFGSMMDYAVNDCGLDGNLFLHMFVSSGLAEQFERGNPKIIAGMSGLDLANRTIETITGETPTVKHTDRTDERTPEFWAGWALAHYQWHQAKSFSSILRAFPFSEITDRYYPLHEADISKFYSVAESVITKASPQTNLKRLRETADLSQAKLAEEAGVSLRSIQMYEQRKKDVNRAQAITLVKIARVLGCEVEDLLESESARELQRNDK